MPLRRIEGGITVQTFNRMAELPETRLNPETTHNTTNNNFTICHSFMRY
jgi:hypothetical protein